MRRIKCGGFSSSHGILLLLVLGVICSSYWFLIYRTGFGYKTISDSGGTIYSLKVSRAAKIIYINGQNYIETKQLDGNEYITVSAAKSTENSGNCNSWTNYERKFDVSIEGNDFPVCRNLKKEYPMFVVSFKSNDSWHSIIFIPKQGEKTVPDEATMSLIAGSVIIN